MLAYPVAFDTPIEIDFTSMEAFFRLSSQLVASARNARRRPGNPLQSLARLGRKARRMPCCEPN